MLNDLELTILSLASEAPRYAAQLEHALDQRGVREWLVIGSSSLQYVLEKLEKQTLVTRTLSTDADPIFSITEGGYGVLQTAVAERLSQPRALGTGFELGLANLNVLKPANVYSALRQHQGQIEHRLQQLEEAAARLAETTPEISRDAAAHAMYSHALALMRAELAWIATFADEWRRRFPAVERTSGNTEGSAATVIHRKTESRGARERAKQVGHFKRPGDE